MAGFYSEMERIVKANGERGLEHCLFYYGIDLKVYRDKKTDVYSKVHSTNSGGIAEFVKNMVGILQSDDFFPSTGNSATDFQTGFLYCKETDILVGDEIRIISADGKKRSYKVVPREAIGQTTEIFSRYKLSAINS